MCARFITKHPTDCMRGLSCAFAHTPDELKTPPDWATELHRAQEILRTTGLGTGSSSSSKRPLDDTKEREEEDEEEWQWWCGEEGIEAEGDMEAKEAEGDTEAKEAEGDKEAKEESHGIVQEVVAKQPKPSQVKRPRIVEPKARPPMVPCPPKTPPPGAKVTTKQGVAPVIGQQQLVAKAAMAKGPITKPAQPPIVKPSTAPTVSKPALLPEAKPTEPALATAIRAATKPGRIMNHPVYLREDTPATVPQNVAKQPGNVAAALSALGNTAKQPAKRAPVLSATKTIAPKAPAKMVPALSANIPQQPAETEPSLSATVADLDCRPFRVWGDIWMARYEWPH